MTSPISGQKDPEQQFRRQLQTLVRNLERSIQDLLANFWEEPFRHYAHELASTLLSSSKAYGFLELASVARAITSLLALRMEDVITLEDALREKLLELVALLKELAAVVAA